jgi:DNA-3-methyladenine glycosylase II
MPQLRRIEAIETSTDVVAGIKALRRKCAVMRRVHDATGQPPLRRNASGFAGLTRIVVGQQVSIASANAIWGRVEAAINPLTAARVGELGDDVLQSAGLSRPKIRTLRAVAAAVTGGMSFDEIADQDDAAARETLTAISGIGPWTADIYLMFCLGRPDTFAPGDLALQVAMQFAFELDERPDAATAAALAERWRPWRAVAARLLWEYYRIRKEAKSGAPV